MNLKIRDLLKQFEKLRIEYVKAWKNGLKETSDKLRYKLAEISQKMSELLPKSTAEAVYRPLKGIK